MSEDRRQDWRAQAVAAAVSAVLHAPMLLGHMPWSHDHPTHLYKAWAFWTQQLAQGRLRGWSEDWFFGYPSGELYPPGSDLWVAAFRALTLGQLSWEATYAVALGGALVFMAVAIQSLGARLVGPWAGAAAAVLWALDLGAVREGGWIYIQLIGVWGQPLSTAFLCLGLAWTWDALEGAGPRRLAAAAGCFALGLLTHSSATLLLAMGLPALALVRGRAAMGATLARLAVVGGLGLLLACFWQVPMMARSSWTSNIGELGPPLSLLLARFQEFGGPFRETHLSVTLLALAGAIVGRRVAGARLLVLAALGLLFFSSGTCYELLRLDRLSTSFAKLQYHRFMIAAKIPWFLLAGLGVASGIGWFRRTRAEARAGAPTGAQVALGLIGAVLVLAALGGALLRQGAAITLRVTPLLDLDGEASWRGSYDALADWIRARRMEEGQFFRVAVDMGHPDDHRAMALPVWTGAPVYKVGYTPANLYRPGPSIADPRLFWALGVRWYVTPWVQDEPWLEEVARIGPLLVYAYRGYRAERAHIQGEGEVTTELMSPTAARLRVTGAGADARLVVHVSAWPRWELRQDGRVIPWEAAPPAEGQEPSLISAPAADGLVELRYVSLPEDRLGALLSLAGLLGVLALVMPGAGLAGRRARLAALAERLAPRVAAVVFGAILILALARWLQPQGDPPLIRAFDNDMTWLPSTFRAI